MYIKPAQTQEAGRNNIDAFVLPPSSHTPDNYDVSVIIPFSLHLQWEI